MNDAVTVRPQRAANAEPIESDSIAVLFVDDEPALLKIIVRILQGSAFEVITASSGEEALAILRARRVDVLVSDIDMPGMTGLELARIARREHPATLRMVLTGAATMERALEAINEGEVQRFFTKPFDGTLFCKTIGALVERIEKLRREGELDGRKARRDELYRWVEAHFPGTLDVTRSAAGEVLVDLRALDRTAESAGWDPACSRR